MTQIKKSTPVPQPVPTGCGTGFVTGDFLQKMHLHKPEILAIAGSAMAKKSWKERNKRKQKTVEKFAKLRAQLKAENDYVGLSMLPRDASPVRVVNRCKISGRRRGYLRRFDVSRITFREMASNGLIPGVTKSSW